MSSLFDEEQDAQTRVHSNKSSRYATYIAAHVQSWIQHTIKENSLKMPVYLIWMIQQILNHHVEHVLA